MRTAIAIVAAMLSNASQALLPAGSMTVDVCENHRSHRRGHALGHA